MDIKGFLKAMKDLSWNTRSSYSYSLYSLARTIKGDDPTRAEIIAWLDGFDSSATLERNKAAVLTWWKWRYPETNEYGVPVTPLVFGRGLFAGKKKSVWRPVDPKVMENIIAHCEDPADKFCLECLNILGCRIRELIGDPRRGLPGITLADITPTGIKMTVKGEKERKVAAEEPFLLRLTIYAMTKEGQIFTQTYSHMNRVVNRLAAELGYSDIHLHDYRHSYTENLLDTGLGDNLVAQARGEDNTNMLMRYSHRTEKDLQDKITKARQGNNEKNTL